VVRIWGKLDDCFRILGEILLLGKIVPVPPVVPEGDIYEVPYNAKGLYDPSSKMILDLSEGAHLVIPIEGAMNQGAPGQVVGKRNGHWSISIEEGKGPCRRLLGRWWVDAALRGAVPSIPVVNRDPVMVPQKKTQKKDKVEEEEKLVLPNVLKIVQTHHTILDVESGDNKHKWGLYLDDSTKPFVEEVTWHLHSTFRNNTVRCTTFPFLISRKGWGTFEVKVSITLKKTDKDTVQHIVEGAHELTFDGEGVVKVTDVDVNV